MHRRTPRLESVHLGRNGSDLLLIPLTVRLSARSQEEFVQNYYPDVMQGGIFIRTEGAHQLELGSPVQLRFLLEDGATVLGGRGIVAWLQRHGNDRGIGVQFRRLSPASHVTYRQMLRLKRAVRTTAQHEHKEDSGVIALNEFDDMPTRPMSLIARGKLLDRTRGRTIRHTPPHLPPLRERDAEAQHLDLNKRVVDAEDIPLPSPQRYRR
ncbi:MAG: PilZ domain-containing protein [Deltaproteobacteria bacterium]|nr:PilZ domain-containing protein [Deltaproteobacteria bacterium]